MTHLVDLPEELLVSIFSLLEPLDIIHIRQTCLTCCHISRTRQIWSNVLQGVLSQEKKQYLVYARLELERMNASDLERASLLPDRFIFTVKSKISRGVQEQGNGVAGLAPLSTPPATSSSSSPLLCSSMKFKMRRITPKKQSDDDPFPTKMYLAPGGRYAITQSLTDGSDTSRAIFQLWDLGCMDGSSKLPVLKASQSLSFSWEARHWVLGVYGARLDERPQLVTIVFHSSNDWEKEKDTLQVYAIDPLDPHPSFSLVGKLSLPSRWGLGFPTLSVRGTTLSGYLFDENARRRNVVFAWDFVHSDIFTWTHHTPGGIEDASSIWITDKYLYACLTKTLCVWDLPPSIRLPSDNCQLSHSSDVRLPILVHPFDNGTLWSGHISVTDSFWHEASPSPDSEVGNGTRVGCSSVLYILFQDPQRSQRALAAYSVVSYTPSEGKGGKTKEDDAPECLHDSKDSPPPSPLVKVEYLRSYRSDLVGMECLVYKEHLLFWHLAPQTRQLTLTLLDPVSNDALKEEIKEDEEDEEGWDESSLPLPFSPEKDEDGEGEDEDEDEDSSDSGSSSASDSGPMTTSTARRRRITRSRRMNTRFRGHQHKSTLKDSPIVAQKMFKVYTDPISSSSSSSSPRPPWHRSPPDLDLDSDIEPDPSEAESSEDDEVIPHNPHYDSSSPGYSPVDRTGSYTTFSGADLTLGRFFFRISNERSDGRLVVVDAVI